MKNIFRDISTKSNSGNEKTASYISTSSRKIMYIFFIFREKSGSILIKCASQNSNVILPLGFMLCVSRLTGQRFGEEIWRTCGVQPKKKPLINEPQASPSYNCSIMIIISAFFFFFCQY